MIPRTIVLALPTTLTLARLLAVPTIVWLILTGEFGWAFWLFLSAGVSDALDGAIARWCDARTVIGGYLDPIADKTLLVSVYLTLGHAGMLPLWLVILVVFRDVLIVGGVLLFHTLAQPLKMEPLIVSKFNTATQIGLAGWVLAMLGFGLADAGITELLIAAAGLTTALSGAAYVVKWGRRLAGMEEA